MRARFWRNVTLIALAHAALFVALLRWAGETKAASAPEITWLSGAAETESVQADAPPETAMSESTPEPAEAAPVAQSEIVLPIPTRASTPSPSATPRPTPKKVKAKPTATPKKKTTPKIPTNKGAEATAKTKENAAKTTVAKNKTGGSAKKSTNGSGNGTSGTSSGKSDSATANYYGNMLHDRFYRAWEQPQTVVASGVKLSAVARIRIEKNGRVSDFKIVKPSENVLLDESVQAAGRKVTQVDALPAGMGSGGHYDVNINFALNSE